MNHWTKKRDEYQQTDWSHQPSLFVQDIVELLPKQGSILDLGAGMGQDSQFFAEHGYDVTSADVVLHTDLALDSVKRLELDHSQPLPFADESFDVVYSHVALHYFDMVTTEQIFSEIYRVLKPGGIVSFLVNSVNDPEYNTGTKLEEDYFETEGTRKRYFSTATAREFAHKFEVILCDENGETYKDRAKNVHNLIRFIGRKA